MATLLSDRDYVSRQYQDSSDFDARVDIYERFATNTQAWTEWLFDRIDLQPGERVLELGCGTGNLWRDNAARLPASLQVMLSDLSEGMLATARERLSGAEAMFEFREFDAQSLPLPDASFDRVIANHMLYHVPDRARALSEVERVLVPGGRFLAGTNDWTHLIEMRELILRFGVKTRLLDLRREPDFFDLETAAEELGGCFVDTRLHRRRDELRITEVEPLVRYIRSMILDAPENDQRLEALAEHVDRHIALCGAFHVNVCAGVVEGRKAA